MTVWFSQWLGNCVIIGRMQLNSKMVWLPRLSAFAVAALLAASVVYWVLRWPAASHAGAPTPELLAAQDSPSAQPAVLASMLGVAQGSGTENAPMGMAARLVLSGIAARTAGVGGVALIAVDGKPARAYPVGNVVVDGLILKAVDERRAMLAVGADAPVSVTLEMKLPVQ